MAKEVPSRFMNCRKTIVAASVCMLLFSIASSLSFADVTAKRIQEPSDGEWLSYGRGYDEQRFSPLTQINRETIDELGLSWFQPTQTNRGMEATPLVADGVMYFSTAWSRVMAVDAETGTVRWQYDPEVPGEAGRNACCDVVNRGVALWGDKVYVGTIDGRLVALDAQTGKPVWSVQTTDPQKPYTITGAPRVIRGKVIIGNGGAEYGVRGYFSAYDADTGAQLWRFYTVPGSAHDPVEHPELAVARRTWSENSRWETGLGGTVWDAFAYDPELNLLYVGVGNSSLYNRKIRSPGGGDNLFLTSILAVNPDTGRLVWHYQTTPAEAWDYTATQHMILAQLEIFGEPRKVLMQAPKNGFFYVLDRATGELISAEKYVPANWASHVDLETGRPVETGLADWSESTAYVTPGPFGGHNWHPMAYSPRTGLVYIPTSHMVYPFTADPDFKYNPGTWNTGEDWVATAAEIPDVMPKFCSPTRLTAWDPIEQAQIWQVPFDSVVNAGVLATAGGLVFQGTTDGRLVAYADDSGDELWSMQLGVGIMAPPITYAIDGQQFVSVIAGLGGAQGGIANKLTQGNAGHVFTFTLGGALEPPDNVLLPRSVRVPETQLDEAAISAGQGLYAVHCLRCHGPAAAGSGVFPDLRTSAPGVHAGWEQIVLGGALAGRGMASFSDVLNKQQAQQIHAYVINQALNSTRWSHKLLETAAEFVCIPAAWLAD